MKRKKKKILEIKAGNEVKPYALQDISLDKKVDHYLVQYERESVPTSAMYSKPPIQKTIFNLPKYAALLLSEQEEMGGPIGGEGGGAPDLGNLLGGGGGGGDTQPAQVPQKPFVKSPTININTFARNVARLINNFDTLCDPKTTVLLRARAYIEKNYDEKTAKEFMGIMEETYNIYSSDKETEIAEKEFQTGPIAGRASNVGGGG